MSFLISDDHLMTLGLPKLRALYRRAWSPNYRVRLLAHIERRRQINRLASAAKSAKAKLRRR